MGWDSSHIVAIAQHGYAALSLRAFFPVYPLLIRALSPFVGFTGAALGHLVGRLLLRRLGRVDVAGRFTSRSHGVVAGPLVWNPVSIFLLAGYADALLVALMIWSLRFCLDRRWWPAAALGRGGEWRPPPGARQCRRGGPRRRTGPPVGPRAGPGRTVRPGRPGRDSSATWCSAGWTRAIPSSSERRRPRAGRPTSAIRSTWCSPTSPGSAAWHFTAHGVDVSHQMRVVYLLDGVVGLLGAALAVAGFVLCRSDRRLLLPAVLFCRRPGDLGGECRLPPRTPMARYILCLAPLYVIVAVCLERLRPLVRLPVVSTSWWSRPPPPPASAPVQPRLLVDLTLSGRGRSAATVRRPWPAAGWARRTSR